MKILTLIILTIISIGITSIENPYGIMYPRGGDEDWGEGAFVVPEKFQIDLYSDLDGTKFGEIRKDEYLLTLFDIHGEKILHYPRKDLEWIGSYNHELLKYKAIKDTEYVKVLWQQFSQELFISRAKLEELGFESFSYQDYLFNTNIPMNLISNREWANIGVNLEKNCLKLRDFPNAAGKKIDCIPGNDWGNKEYNHIEIIKSEENWAFIEVTYYCIDEEDEASEYSCTGKILRSKQGWVKAIDEKGFPNIWFSVTSY